MSDAHPDAAGAVNPLVLIDTPLAAQGLEALIHQSLAAGCEVMVTGAAGDPPLTTAGLPAGVHLLPTTDGKRGETLKNLAAAAARTGWTHLMTLDRAGGCKEAPALLAAGCREAPAAVVVGVRRFGLPGGRASAGAGRRVSDFWFRVQTGLAVRDSAGGLRVYPVALVEKLETLARRASFDYEMLVRAAWGGARIHEVEVPAGTRCSGASAGIARRLFEGLVHLALNVHLTMRSITPWPHRRIARRDPGTGSVSLLRPWRSLRLLVGQNISARRLGQAAALGVFLGTLPLVACHSIAILFAAGYFRLNKVTALSASQLCMPPIVPALCVEVGHFLRHGAFLTEISLRTLGYEALDRVFEWLIGSLVLAPVLAAAAGAAAYLMARRVERRLGAGGDASPGLSKN